MKAILTKIAAALLLASLYAPVSAKSEDIKFTMLVEQEVVQTQPDGRKRVRTVPAEKVVPGGEVIYTIFFENTSSDPLGNIVITDPIPGEVRYINGSAFGAGTNISYSIDGGKRYADPSELKVKLANGRVRLAEPGEYSHIKWVYQGRLQPQDRGYVSFRAVVR